MALQLGMLYSFSFWQNLINHFFKNFFYFNLFKKFHSPPSIAAKNEGTQIEGHPPEHGKSLQAKEKVASDLLAFTLYIAILNTNTGRKDSMGLKGANCGE